MSVFKKTVLMNVLSLSVTCVMFVASVPDDAVAGFKWTAPASNKTQFPVEGMKSQPYKPEINWGKKSNIVHNDQAPIVEEALPAPVTMETLDTIKDGGVANKVDVKTDDSKVVEIVSGDITSSVVNEDKNSSTVIASSADPETMQPTTKTVSVSSSFKVKEAETIQGFGKEIPLVLAIRQIVPSDHPFAFDKNINLAQRVSWNGNKPWDDVLNEALSTVGLDATKHNSIIMISKAKTKEVIISAPKPKMMEPKEEIVLEDHHNITAPETNKVTELPQDMGIKTTANSPLWRAYKGQTLRNVLTAWSKRENITLYWTVDYDYRLNEDVLLEGEYNTVLGKLLDKFSDVSPQPYGKLSKDDAGKDTLVIDIYDQTG